MKLNTIKPFNEFINESNSNEIAERITRLAVNCVYEAETGEVTITVNEGYVKDLQLHIRKVLDILTKEYSMKSKEIDKELEKNLTDIVTSFQKGESPAETAEIIVS